MRSNSKRLICSAARAGLMVFALCLGVAEAATSDLERAGDEALGRGDYRAAVDDLRHRIDAIDWKGNRTAALAEAIQAHQALGRIYLRLACYAQAVVEFEFAIASLEKRDGALSNGPELWALLQDIGTALAERRELDLAAQTYESVARLLQDHGGLDRPEAARAVNGVGAVYQVWQHPAIAEISYRQALVLATKTGDDLLVAQIESNLGSVRESRGDLVEAERLYQDSFKRRMLHAADRPEELVYSYRELGDFHRTRDGPAAALDEYQHALASSERRFGPYHPTVIRDLEKLAKVYDELARPRDAAAMRARRDDLCSRRVDPAGKGEDIGMRCDLLVP